MEGGWNEGWEGCFSVNNTTEILSVDVVPVPITSEPKILTRMSRELELN